MTTVYRRDFLKQIVKFAFIFIGILFFPFVFSFKALRGIQRGISFFYLSTTEELPRREVKRFEVTIPLRGQESKALRIYVVRVSDGWIALSPVCTHLGCMVNYSRTKKEFICPCHGGRYNMMGEVIGGPPPYPLTRLPLRIEDGKVFVGFKI